LGHKSVVFVEASGVGASNVDLNYIKKSVGTAVQSFPVSFIPPMLHTHTSLMYHCRYVNFASDDVVK
jgi:hypothetical protein